MRRRHYCHKESIWVVDHLRLVCITQVGIKLKGCHEKLDEMMLHIYYLYQKSPKKLQELREIHDTYKEMFESEEDNLKAKQASGTHWIDHKVKTRVG